MKNTMKTIDLSNLSRQELEENYIKLSTQLEQEKQKVSWLEEQFRLSRAKRFGTSSEQSKVDFEQCSLFNEAEYILSSEEPLEEPKMSQVSPPVRKKKKGHKERLVQSLPKETIEYRLSVEELICTTCGNPLKTMKKSIRKELCVIPAKVYVKEHVQYLYACKHCQETGESNPITGASAPKPLFRNSLASPSLVSYILSRKFVNAMPLYRQEQEYNRNGIKLSRQTMANWMIQCTEQYLFGIYDSMKEDLLALDIIHSDDTGLEVLHEPGREATDKSFMWLYCSGKHDKPMVLYEYASTRSGDIPKNFLKGFRGYLQTDGYAGYHKLTEEEDGVASSIVPVGCWAHARRKYTDAQKAQSKEAKQDPNSAIAKGIDYCNLIFHLESEMQKLPIQKRKAARKEQLEPLLEEYFAWVEKLRDVVLKGKLQEALTYSINQKICLRNFLLDERLECSNNRAERFIKPFVIGRKNFLFCNTPTGAEASAVLYSLVETAKGNGLDPFRYFTYVLDSMKEQKAVSKEYLKSLLPYSDKIPDSCKSILESQ